MSILLQSVKFIRKVVVIMLLPLLATSCQMVTDDSDFETDNGTAKQYINITISVAADQKAVTRAPSGGEYGDGTEKGIERENLVNNITLIFYQDNTGINTTSDDAKVVCVKSYAVRPFTDDDLPNNHIHKTDEPASVQNNEVLYTTGNQKLEETPLQVGQSYKVLVVANASVNVSVGESIKDVREKVLSSIYTGNGIGINASNFVMTSESDATMTLSNPTIDTSSDVKRFVYYFDCIHIERMSARIDYCTRGATYDATYGGYVYEKKHGPQNDKTDLYVVTKVIPFNLYNESEYIFKRVQDAWPATSTIYLGNESTTNYVVDPFTAGKDNNETTINYINRLSVDLATDAQVMSEVHETSLYYDGSFGNIIIAYPRENTLLPGSLLKKYATGIIFEVDYYREVNDTNHPHPKETRRYYHYLRHQGETLNGQNHNYETRRLDENHGPKSFAEDNETCVVAGQGPGAGNVLVPMRCGIVRNNIYRVSVAGFSDEDGTIILSIEEEKWRHVDNPTIYI